MATDSRSTSSKEQIEHASIVDNSQATDPAIQNDTFAIDREALGDNLPNNYYRSLNFIGTIVALCLGSISNYLGYVLPANVLTFINQDIGPSPNITWVTLSYTLGLSVGFLIFGRLSDIFGRRWFFIAGNGLGLIGSIIGATASNINALIGADVLAGLGGAIQISFTIAVSELVPNKIRGMVISAMFFASFEIACFGPVIGQALVTNTQATWRWAYYLNIIVSALAVICFYFFYHPPNFHMLHVNRSKMEQCKRQDFVGFILFTGGLILFIMGLSWGGVVYPWKSAHVIATIIVGFFTLIVFVLWDAYVHRGDPLLPTHLFRSPGYLAMITTATVGSCVYYSMNVLWPQQIIYLFAGTEIHNGWLACVVGSSCLIGQLIGGPLSRFIKRSRLILITGCCSLLAFAGAMVSVNPGQQAKAIALIFMACFSVGIIETCSFALMPLTLPTEDIGAALGALGSIRSGGASVATAIYTTVLNNKLDIFIPPAVTAAAIDAGLPKSSIPSLMDNLSSGTFDNVPGINEDIISAVGLAQASAAADAFRYVWYAVIAFACVALGASVLTIDYGAYLTDDVARKMHGRSTHMRQAQPDEETGQRDK
ncbi:fungal trichothecene efflux pump [Aspergillus ambiguus]|uniref:trichothecene efflux pump n=1 Tax=Aspergillus ambiguus TaxID=176160 RepID=UPI003CCD2103